MVYTANSVMERVSSISVRDGMARQSLQEESIASQLDIATLGGVRIFLDGAAYDPFATRKVVALLVYVALAARPVPREALATLLWGDRSQSAALTNLRVALSDVRKHAGDFVAITRQTVAVSPAVTIDARALIAGVQGTPFDADRATAALERYQGDFLAGFHLRDTDSFESWAATERERLHRVAVDGCRRVAAARLAGGDREAAVWAVRRQLQLDPLAEDGYRALMRLLVDAGRSADALIQFERCRALLDAELGVAPSTATVALADAIRRGQIEPASLPALAIVTPPEHRLPAPPSPLFGRESELATLDQLLHDDHVRLVSIVGVGGMGKTRLAIAAAHQLSADPHDLGEVTYVPLTAAQTASQAETAIAEALSLTFSEDEARAAQLVKRLRRGPHCLILDNVEQIERGAALAARLLREAPDLKLLVTSRERLQLRAEHVLELRGLPHVGQGVALSPAATLFLAAARRLRPDLTAESPATVATIDRICRLVEGLPLALELAAGWSDTLPLPAIAGAIENGLDLLATTAPDVPPRQRSMRTVFDATWRQLGPELQTLLAGFAVFRGGFTRDAAAEVCGATVPQLAQLIRHVLVAYDATADRYAMHELWRQYAAERLAAQPTLAARMARAHSTYYISWLRRHSETIRIARRPLHATAVDADMANVELAWQHALATDDVDLLVAGVEDIGGLFIRSHRLRDGQALFDRVLARSERVVITADDARWRYVMAVSSVWRADFTHLLHYNEPIQPLLHRAIRLLCEPDVARYASGQELPKAYRHLGNALAGADAIEAFQLGLVAARQSGDAWAEANLLDELSEATLRIGGDLAQARSLALQSYAIRRQMRALDGWAWSAHTLCWLALFAGEFAAARERAAESFELRRRLAAPNGQARARIMQGTVALVTGRFEAAERFFTQGLALLAQTDNRRGEFDGHFGRACALVHLGRWHDAEAAAEECRVAARAQDHAVGEAYAAIIDGMLLLYEDCAAEAASCFETAVPALTADEAWISLAHCYALLALARLLTGHADKEAAVARAAEAVRFAWSYPPAAARLAVVRALWAVGTGDSHAAEEYLTDARSQPLVANSRWFEALVRRYRIEPER